MPERIVGQVKRVNGPVITIQGITDVMMMELVHVGEQRLVGEVVKLDGDQGIVQVYEEATGIAPHDNVYGSSMPLSVELGPGLIGTIYDGIQRPLERLRQLSGDSIRRGIESPALDRKRSWDYRPTVSVTDQVALGQVIAVLQETERVEHRILVPPTLPSEGPYTVVEVAPAGNYTVDQVVCILQSPDEQRHEIRMVHNWPIRVPRPVSDRIPLSIPLITGQRVIDMLFPLAKGGTVAIPGGFGTGKTMTQHSIARWCDADIIVYIGCGERGNEMTDVLREFPHLIDPRTGRSLMERTILIANTSNMPVSAREASIYTGVTLAEYYRDQGYHVAIMADSTSRWAEALRELSGRMEEMPAEEGFPAYLPTRIAEFYERAGYMRTLSGSEGSVSIIGAVSPPGGDFSEPVTQHTKRFVRCFWGLDRSLASARHYPAISWLESYSEYVEDVAPWWETQAAGSWKESREEIMELLQKEVRLQQIVKLVGPDALPDSQNFILEVCSLFKTAFLQQNAFDDIDRYSSVEKQMRMLQLILSYWHLGSEAIAKGVTMVKLRRMKVVQDIAKMRFTVSNDAVEDLDKIAVRLERSMSQLGGIYDEQQ
jgi:V/A-type H+-transporting ATPase subunit A